MSPASLKAVYFTPGAGGMICGSCLNDNMLAAAMQRAGHDVVLAPLYTPIRTDEADVSLHKVFFGGVNVYLQQKSALFRHLPRWADRPLDSFRFLRAVTKHAVSTDAGKLGDLALSMARGEQGRQKKEAARLVDWLRRDLRPNLVHFSNLMIAGCAPRIQRELRCPVLATLQGDDIFLDALREPWRRQTIDELRRLAAQIDGFLVHSDFYAEAMSQYFDIPRDKFHRVPLGLSLDDFPPRDMAQRAGAPPTIGFLARICEAKGLHNLVDAFVELRRRPGLEAARLHAAGWLGGKTDEAYFAAQQAKLAAAGALDAFHYAGEVDRPGKLRFLAEVDVLSVPTTYHEPKGRYVLEALASGVPAVQPAHGAFPELIERTGGGRLVPPNDPMSLADALQALLLDHDERRRLGEQGRRAMLEHHSADRAAEAVIAVFRQFLHAATP